MPADTVTCRTAGTRSLQNDSSVDTVTVLLLLILTLAYCYAFITTVCEYLRREESSFRTTREELVHKGEQDLSFIERTVPHVN